jgi:hypothetical protein
LLDVLGTKAGIPGLDAGQQRRMGGIQLVGRALARTEEHVVDLPLGGGVA